MCIRDSPVAADNKFNKELRSALNFAIWADKNGYGFDEDGVNPKKLSTEPTPLLEALLDGYYKYHLEKQKILSENKIEKEQEWLTMKKDVYKRQEYLSELKQKLEKRKSVNFENIFSKVSWLPANN